MKSSDPFVNVSTKVGAVGCRIKPQTDIPDDFPIKRCKPSTRGRGKGPTVRPRKRGKTISWAIAEALAPGEPKPRMTQEEKVQAEIAHLRAENANLKAN